MTAADAATDGQTRRPTRQLVQPDLPAFERDALDPLLREGLVELLLTLADDEFVIGFRDSEWTGIAPMLEEDVAFSSLAQDEIGHARVWYEMIAALTGDDADRLAFHRAPHEYRHARLLDHPRNDWGFTIIRRWLYDTTDAVRLEALARSSFAPLAEVVAKVRREERYHLMHLDAWLRRLAGNHGTPREAAIEALATTSADVLTVFAPLAHEQLLVDAGVLEAPMSALAARWRSDANAVLTDIGLPTVPAGTPPADGRDRPTPSESFRWLWEQFTSVARLEQGVEW